MSFEQLLPQLKQVIKALKTGRVGEMEDAVEGLPETEKIPGAYRGFVREARERIERKHQRGLEMGVRELTEEDIGDMRGEKLSAAGPEQIFGERYVRYDSAIAKAQEALEEGDKADARRYIKDLTFANAPGDRLEHTLRRLKEKLGVK